MKKLIVNAFAEKRIKQGQNLLLAQDFPDLDFSNQFVELYTAKGQFLGLAYLSDENRGIGWVISKKQCRLDHDFWLNIFRKAREKRSHFEADSSTNAYRLFNQEGDGFGGFTIDRYDKYAVFSWYNAFVYQLKDDITSAFCEVYPEISGCYEKIRFKGLDFETRHICGSEAPEQFLIKENGVNYQVFMNHGLMTGIFLDQHEVRAHLADGFAAGKTVLNMFSYTAAFSVAAAMGGASQTTSVDLAKRSRELSKAHFLANHLQVDHHKFVVMDVFDYFKYAKRHQLKFDVIILDPPSFARNKKQTFSVVKDYHKLITQSLEILAPEGHLIASTNASHLGLEKFKASIKKGLGQRQYQFLDLYRLPSDFTYNKQDESSNYLKVFTIKVE